MMTPTLTVVYGKVEGGVRGFAQALYAARDHGLLPARYELPRARRLSGKLVDGLKDPADAEYVVYLQDMEFLTRREGPGYLAGELSEGPEITMASMVAAGDDGWVYGSRHLDPRGPAHDGWCLRWPLRAGELGNEKG